MVTFSRGRISRGDEEEARSRSSRRVSSFPGILIVTVSLPLLALGLWQLFLSSRTRTYTWASTCPGPARRALFGGDSISNGMSFAKARGSTKYISVRAFASPRFLSRADTHRTRQPLSWELSCKTAAVSCASSCSSFPRKRRGRRLRNSSRCQPVLP